MLKIVIGLIDYDWLQGWLEIVAKRFIYLNQFIFIFLFSLYFYSFLMFSRFRMSFVSFSWLFWFSLLLMLLFFTWNSFSVKARSIPTQFSLLFLLLSIFLDVSLASAFILSFPFWLEPSKNFLPLLLEVWWNQNFSQVILHQYLQS